MTPIALVQIEPALVVTRNDSPYETLGDFISAAKQKPGQLKQSGGSITSRENVVRQLLMTHTGARWSFISFPGGGERLAALLGGHVDLMILDPSEAREQVRSGKLRVLAQAAEKRLPDFQDVPTLKEAGFDVPDVPQIRTRSRSMRSCFARPPGRRPGSIISRTISSRTPSCRPRTRASFWASSTTGCAAC
jgi:putative tricarboxylic transport membrane protein